MDALLQGYADAWAGRDERRHRDEELQRRYLRGYNEGLEDLKRSTMFNRSAVSKAAVPGEELQIERAS